MKNNKICVIGLGYVGLPLAVHLSKHFNLVGFDNNEERILSLKRNIDKTNETKKSELKKSKILFTSKTLDIQRCNVYIVTVPTPIDSKNNPLITSLIETTKIIASKIKNDDLHLCDKWIDITLTYFKDMRAHLKSQGF